MKKLNKKGFTIVELVIVIAVIAILAAVLIPTFATVINKANENAALQQARNAYTEYVADLGANITTAKTNVVVKTTVGTQDYYFAVVGGQMNITAHKVQLTADEITALYATPNAAVSAATLGSEDPTGIFIVNLTLVSA